jgi:hypothetical protein
MDANRFRDCLTALNWSQRSLAKLLKINAVTVQRWATGGLDIPAPIAGWLQTLAQCHRAHPRPDGWMP